MTNIKQLGDREVGYKDDGDKIRLELVPPELIIATGTILTLGARKYSAGNWEKGMSWSRVFGALLRHLYAWYGGKGLTLENYAFGPVDDETGHSHLWHAACCLAFLITYEKRGDYSHYDDRPDINPAAKGKE